MRLNPLTVLISLTVSSAAMAQSNPFGDWFGGGGGSFGGLHGYQTRGPCKEIYQSQAEKKRVYIHIDIESSTLTMDAPGVNGAEPTQLQTKASTANMSLDGAVETKRGCFVPHTLDKSHPSTEYPGATMDDSVFFCGGEAIHVDPTSEGSHGCVHVNRASAEKIYNAVQHFGLNNTAVCID